MLFFVGDFEQGGIQPWTFAINGDQVQVVDFEGDKAGFVHLTKGSGRSRQEIAHEPGARTKEGLETYYAWSFYFPEPLAKCRQDIGYWEQRGASRRTINVAVIGDQLQLETVFATGTDFRPQFTTTVTARQWHRIAWHIKWSQDPNVGFVEGWYDGEPAMARTPHRTLLDATDIFAHVGFLRNDDGAACNYAVQDMYVDNGMEATSLEEVMPRLDLPEPMPEAGGAAGAGGSAGVSGSAGASGSAGVSGSAGATSLGGSGGAGGEMMPMPMPILPAAQEPVGLASGNQPEPGCAVGGSGGGFLGIGIGIGIGFRRARARARARG